MSCSSTVGLERVKNWRILSAQSKTVHGHDKPFFPLCSCIRARAYRQNTCTECGHWAADTRIRIRATGLALYGEPCSVPALETVSPLPYAPTTATEPRRTPGPGCLTELSDLDPTHTAAKKARAASGASGQHTDSRQLTRQHGPRRAAFSSNRPAGEAARAVNLRRPCNLLHPVFRSSPHCFPREAASPSPKPRARTYSPAAATAHSLCCQVPAPAKSQSQPRARPPFKATTSRAAPSSSQVQTHPSRGQAAD